MSDDLEKLWDQPTDDENDKKFDIQQAMKAWGVDDSDVEQFLSFAWKVQHQEGVDEIDAGGLKVHMDVVESPESEHEDSYENETDDDSLEGYDPFAEDEGDAEPGESDDDGKGFSPLSDGSIEGEAPDHEPSGALIWNLENTNEDFADKVRAMISQKGGRTVQRFTTCIDFADYVWGPTPVGGLADDERITIQQRYTNSVMNTTLDECKVLSYKGWPKGIEAIKKFTDRLKSVVVGSIVAPVQHYEVSGQQLDVGKLMSGEPEVFLTDYDEEQEKKSRKPTLVRIIATIDITSTPTSAIYRGAAVAALTQLLEMNGYSVQIDLHCGSNEKIDTWVRAKEFGQSVYMETLVFFLAHPTVFHYMVMGAWEHLPKKFLDKACRGLGMRNYGFISEPLPDDRGDVYVSAMGARWIASEESTVKWIKKELARQGIELVEKEIVA